MRGMWLLCAGVVAVGGSCYRLGAYACTEDANCVDGDKRGVCEATGFCAYPDEACESGRRYDDLAGEGLAGQCVEPDTSGATTSMTMTMSMSGSNATLSGSETGDESGTESGNVPTCLDDDGDGYGEGEACAGPDCDDDNGNVSDACVYIGPGGDDGAAGTRDAPWLTFSHAVGTLTPGSSLVVLSGTYDPAVHGFLDVSCTDETAVSGTAQRPIFVRADVEREAHLQTGGTSQGLEIDGCAYWRFRGLRVSGADAPNGASSLITVRDSSDVELRRLLVHTSNRYFSGPMLWTTGSADVLIEECEAYDFNGTAFTLYGQPGNIVRRCYLHGRGREDLEGCVDGSTPDVPECSQYGNPDHGLIIRDGSIVENTVVEGATFGLVGSATQNAKVFGSIALTSTHGLVFSYDEGLAEHSTDIEIEHFVAIGQSSRAVYLRSTGAVSLRHVTALGAAAFRSDRDGGTTGAPCPADGCVLSAANLLSIDAGGDGMGFTDGTGGVAAYCNSTGSMGDPYLPSSEPFDDDEGLFQQSLNIPVDDIGLGPDACIAYVPEGSAMKGAGEDGQDIGANILYRYEGGVPTSEPLWDPDTGAFPCGAVIAGVNDTPGDSCIGLRERVHVATAGCPLPDGYP